MTFFPENRAFYERI